MRSLAIVGALVLLLASGAIASAAAPYFAVTDLGTLGGANSIANDINDAGQVVGSADLPDGSTHACIWNGGPIQDMGGLGGNPSEALRINAGGVVVGDAYNASGVQKPTRWTNGVIEDLSPGGGAGIAEDINDLGQIALWPATAINNSGIYARHNPDIYWSTESSAFANLHQQGFIYAISDSNLMAVTYTATGSGFIFDTGGFVKKWLPNGEAYNVNYSGMAVGRQWVGDWHAVQFSETGGIVDLNSAIAPGQGWVLTIARGINASGQIVGQGTINGKSHAFLLTPAPPPPAASVQVNPSLDFGAVPGNTTSAAQTLTITNSGNASLNISSVALSGANASEFSVSGGTGLTVAAGATTDLTLTFSPKTIGSRSASLTITSNAANSPNTVALTGSGTGAQVQVDSSRVFGTVVIGSASLPQTVVVTNTGTMPLTISSVSFSVANPGDFTVTGGTGVTVPVNGTTPLTVTFAPTASGNRSANLVITSNAVNSPNSVSLSGVGAPPPPAAPSGLSAQAVGTKINLTWTDNSNNETAMEVYRQVGGGSLVLLTVLAPNTTSYTDSGMVGSTVYTYEVRAANDWWASAYSNTASVTTASPPAAPTGLTAVGFSYNSVSLAWTDNSNNETAFEIYRKPGSGAYTLVGLTVPNATSYVDTTVSPATSYTYQVRAANDFWASAYTNVVNVTTMQSPPAAPSGLSAQAVGTKISLHWTDNSNNETAMEVYRKVGGGSLALLTVLAPNTTSYTDTSVVGSTIYTYQVRAANDFWASSYTNAASVTTQFPPAAPDGLTATVVSSTQINLTWIDHSNNETALEVYRQTGTGAFTLAAVLPPGSTTFADKGMAQHTTYTYRVRAANDYWASAYTNVASAHTP